MENQKLKGQSALVTGANSGLGKAIAVELAREGAQVVINYVADESATNEVLEEIKSFKGTAIAIYADVSKEDQVQNMFSEMKKEFGTIDILVNNAGVQRDSDFQDMTLKDWQTVLDINLTGQFLCSRQAVREFISRGMVPERSKSLGKILCMSSVHEIIPWSNHVNYAASKGGINMLMKSMAQELGHLKIRINSIAPGAIKTHINQSVWSDEQQLNKLMLLIPYKRIGEPIDVAKLAAWLCSDESEYIHGTSIYIDGGMTLYPGFTENG